ncbi:hypothetical protein [Methylosinus sporium]|uniref:hypothetical protein n=1 Tax=Methylosinus sporium TaxID=428 RepID=UPI00142D279F|nr:hypothetical protein [Methylosinus sporium]
MPPQIFQLILGCLNAFIGFCAKKDSQSGQKKHHPQNPTGEKVVDGVLVDFSERCQQHSLCRENAAAQHDGPLVSIIDEIVFPFHVAPHRFVDLVEIG